MASETGRDRNDAEVTPDIRGRNGYGTVNKSYYNLITGRRKVRIENPRIFSALSGRIDRERYGEISASLFQDSMTIFFPGNNPAETGIFRFMPIIPGISEVSSRAFLLFRSSEVQPPIRLNVPPLLRMRTFFLFCLSAYSIQRSGDQSSYSCL